MIDIISQKYTHFQRRLHCKQPPNGRKIYVETPQNVVLVSCILPTFPGGEPISANYRLWYAVKTSDKVEEIEITCSDHQEQSQTTPTLHETRRDKDTLHILNFPFRYAMRHYLDHLLYDETQTTKDMVIKVLPPLVQQWTQESHSMLEYRKSHYLIKHGGGYLVDSCTIAPSYYRS